MSLFNLFNRDQKKPKTGVNNLRPLKVFLSHAHSDRDAVRELYSRLKSDGIDAWLDREKLLPGQDWELEIRKAVIESDAVIVCLSKQFNQAGFRQKEVRLALDEAMIKPEGTIFIIPVRLEECDTLEVLRKWHWVDLFESDGYEMLIRALRARAERIGAGLNVVKPLEIKKPTKEKSKGEELKRDKKEELYIPPAKTEADIKADRKQQIEQVVKEFARTVGINVSLAKTYDDLLVFDWNLMQSFEDLQLHGTLPILASLERKTSEKNIEFIRQILIERVTGKGRISLLFLFCDPELLDTARRSASILKDVYAYNVVLFDQKNLVDIASSQDQITTLRRFILSQIDLTTISPYIITGPTPEDFFFGREHELREITEHIKSSSYTIIGGRRIGKTSILNRLHRVRLKNAGFRTIYNDCSVVTDFESFLATPIRSWQPDSPINAPSTFGELLNNPPKDKPLVLLLDEADKLVPSDKQANWKLFNTLRSLVNSNMLQVVLSGERTLQDALRDSKSPLFNFANEIILGPLDYKAVDVLVTQPLKRLEIELIGQKEIVDQIWSFTSGHPNIVQRLCRRLIEKINKSRVRRISIEDVNDVIRDVNFQRQDFLDTYWENTSNLEKIVTLIMVELNHVSTLSEIRQAIFKRCDFNPSASQTDDALKRLTDLRSILKRTDHGYGFAVESFPRVVTDTLTLNDMFEILTENYEGESNGNSK